MSLRELLAEKKRLRMEIARLTVDEETVTKYLNRLIKIELKIKLKDYED
ncbi:hypothetical protein [Phormidesmis sp. 146-33]